MPNLPSLSPFKYLIPPQTRPLSSASLLELLVIAILIQSNAFMCHQYTPYFVISLPVLNPFTMSMCALHFVFQLIFWV